MEDLQAPDLARSEAWFNHNELVSILVREDEVAAAKEGRKRTSIAQMEMFDDALHPDAHFSACQR